MSLPQFTVEGIITPRIDFTLNRTQIGDPKYEQAFRVEALVTHDDVVRLLFGVSLTSLEKQDDIPSFKLIVETVSDFKLTNKLGNVSKVKDIPMVGNMLALIYPFIREKVNYCFGANGIHFFLPPINTIDLVNKNNDSPSFRLFDNREMQPALASSK